MKLFSRKKRPTRLERLLADNDAAEKRLKAGRHERNERLLAESVDQDLMAVALLTCDDCLFWDNDADRARFKPCKRHEDLFARTAVFSEQGGAS